MEILPILPAFWVVWLREKTADDIVMNIIPAHYENEPEDITFIL
jgi:hypothetical protein